MKKVLLCIMDGVGIRENKLGNAYLNANTKTLDSLMKEYPHVYLKASGEAVGLPEGTIGNSEVGHATIGSGRIILESLEKINRSIRDGSFFSNNEFLNAIKHAKENNSKLHLIGLISDAGVHSDINHLYKLLELCKKENFSNVYIHAITDGRDTSPTSGIKYINELELKIKEIGVGKIASIGGRYYIMDRDNNYDRVKLAYDMLTIGNDNTYLSASDAWQMSQDNGITDEFIKPSLILKSGIIEDNDSVISFNFRPDRLREFYACLSNKDFTSFDRKILNNLYIVTMMPISNDAIVKTAYTPDKVSNVLSEVIERNGLSQLRIAETEKFVHVTYFFDGGREIKLDRCKKILIPSPKVATYDLKPEMSAYLITDNLLEELKNKPDLIVLNFANGDMVGHTGVYPKGVMAMEVVDSCIKRIIDYLDLDEYTMIVTADHGNCEQMINDDGSVNTQHTTNLVPFIVLDKSIKLRTGAFGLSNIAPTILDIMGLVKPDDMTMDSLIVKK